MGNEALKTNWATLYNHNHPICFAVLKKHTLKYNENRFIGSFERTLIQHVNSKKSMS